MISSSTLSGGFALATDAGSFEDSDPVGSFWLENPAEEPRTRHVKGHNHPGLFISHEHLPSEFFKPLSLMWLDEHDGALGHIHDKQNFASMSSVGSLICLATVGAMTAVSPQVTFAPTLQPATYILGRELTRLAGPARRWADITVSGFVERSESAAPAKLTIDSVQQRIIELQEIAADEGYAISDASLADLRALFQIMSIKLAPSLFALDNGNIRISWRDSIHRHASFELLGASRAKPVLFSQDSHGNSNQLYGIVSLDAVPKLLFTAGLDRWILNSDGSSS